MSRPTRGRLNGITGEPGTILGPNLTGEYIVIVDVDASGVSVAYANLHELAAVREPDHTPRSVAEHRIRKGLPA